MVQSGQAFVYRQYLGRCDRGAYLAAERQAQAQRLGVWAVPGGLRGPGISGMGERATATEGRSQPGHPQARPSLALKLPSPAGPRPPASRSAPLPGPRSCKGRPWKNRLSPSRTALRWLVVRHRWHFSVLLHSSLGHPRRLFIQRFPGHTGTPPLLPSRWLPHWCRVAVCCRPAGSK